MSVGGNGWPAVELGIDGITDATRVGQGGFGTVYLALQKVCDRTVAVKVLSTPALDEDALRRFEQECRAIGALSGHPHVVPVYDSGHTAAGQPYLVLDYLSGGTLAQHIAERGPMPWEDVADIGVKLAGALAAAHAAGVLHRDIKPENVLMSSYGEPQLTDFGVARIQGGTQTKSGVITGSLAHAAPEVLSGRPATEASDVYSLASTLYALVAGHAPFVHPGDETFHPLLTRIMSEAPPDLRRQGLPGPMWDALAAALAKDPSRRTSSARALGEALRVAQRAGDLNPTRLVAPEPAAAAAALAGGGGAESLTSRWARPWSAGPPVSSGSGPPVNPRRRATPAWLVALAVALVALVAATALALTQTDDRDDEEGDVAQPATTTVPGATTAAPAAPAQSATTSSTVRAPVTTRPVSPASPASPAGTAGTAAATGPAGAVPACTASFFRPTITSDRPSYRNGETVQVSARFENVSGRACSYSSTNASSQVLGPSGEPLTPVRTLPGSNPQGIAFEPGTSQTFQSSWDTAICSSPSACFPGRYTMVMDVTPFGGGRVSFDVT